MRIFILSTKIDYVQGMTKGEVRIAKDIFRKKLEEEFRGNNSKRTWDYLKQITGSGKQKKKATNKRQTKLCQ